MVEGRQFLDCIEMSARGAGENVVVVAFIIVIVAIRGQ